MQSYEIDEIIELGRWAFQIEPLVSRDMSVKGTLDFRLFDEMVISSVNLPRLRMNHDPKLLRAIDNDYVLFEMVDGGSKIGMVNDQFVQQDRQNIIMIDMSRQFRCVTDDLSTCGILIPHGKIGFDPSRHPAYVSHSVESERGRLLFSAARTFLNKVRRLDPADETSAFSAAFLGLVRTLVMNEADPQYELADADREKVLRSLIERNLTNPVLGPEFLASQLGVSRSALYRLFKDDGGISQYITERRLKGAFADLLAGSAERGVVKRAAERWGFQDQSLFHRRFRQRFGITPRECLSGRGKETTSANGSVWHPVMDWMSKSGRRASR